MALAKPKNFVNAVYCSGLGGYHPSRLLADFFEVSGVLELAIPPVARTLLRILAAVETSTEGGSFNFLTVINYILVKSKVFSYINPLFILKP